MLLAAQEYLSLQVLLACLDDNYTRWNVMLMSAVGPHNWLREALEQEF